jgi:hypothetical protein
MTFQSESVEGYWAEEQGFDKLNLTLNLFFEMASISSRARTQRNQLLKQKQLQLY